VKYHLYDKYFVEYHGRPGERVTIRHRKNGGATVEEELIEMYHGIYVRQFVLFFGDVLYYEIHCHGAPSNPVVTDEVTLPDAVEDGQSSRYGLLNAMESDMVYGNEQALAAHMGQFERLQEMTDALFIII